jgi:hypothetical protein
MRAARERLDVQRLRVLPVDPVANPPQQGEVAQVLGPWQVCWTLPSPYSVDEPRREVEAADPAAVDVDEEPGFEEVLEAHGQ